MRPNILIISADQHRADCLGVAGRQVKTPHLDALAHEGTRFSYCITPSITCQPARASILTGQLGTTNGVYDSGIDLDPAIGEKGFAGTLGANGYQTAFFGKAHFSTYYPETPTGTPECVASSAKYGADWNGPYMGFSHVELTLQGKSGWDPVKPPLGHHFERHFHADGKAEHKKKLYRTQGGKPVPQSHYWHSALPPAHHTTPWTADRAIEWLRHGRDKAQPFCSWISFQDINHPFDCPEPWSRLHSPKDVDLTNTRELDRSKLPWWYRSALERDSHADDSHGARNGRVQTSAPPEAELRQIVANTYGKIAFIDDQIGRIMNALAEQGLLENTHVFYLSDHGDWLGDHGLVMQGPLFFDSLMRVPLIWRGPDVPVNRTVYEPVSTLDLSPSLMEVTGIHPALEQHGTSLVHLLDGQSKRDFALSEWVLPPGRVNAEAKIRSVRTRTYKIIRDMNSGQGELYDLLTDPNEHTNLFDDPKKADLRMRLESYLMHAMPPSDKVA